MADDGEEEEDYMSMALPDAGTTKKPETSLQRRVRKEREGIERGRVKNKAEKASEEAAAREAALETQLDRSNKGFKMMEKLGFKGGALGKGDGDGLTQPINPVMKEGRSGIGLDAQKKREAREQLEGQAKKSKATEDEYRDHMRREVEVKRLEGQLIGAQKVAEELDEQMSRMGTEAEETSDEESKVLEEGTMRNTAAQNKKERKHTGASKPLKKINVLWRGRVKQIREKDRERRMRHDLYKSLSSLPTYADPDKDKDYQTAFGKEEEEVEDEDPELDEFESLELEERLTRLVEYLRQERYYCFWCKYRYPNAEMDGCPGLTEDEHG